MSDWKVDLAAQEARHRSGLVLRFRIEADGGFSGEGIAGLAGIGPDDAARIAREGGEVFVQAVQARRLSTLLTVGQALYGSIWQRELARAIGIDDSYLRKVIRGARPVTARLMADLRALVARRRAEVDAAADALDRTI
jgi:transcriptional regulator with XRE-family HTH domain